MITSSIPFKFVAEWARRNSSVYPEARYAITLNNKEEFVTLSEIYSPSIKQGKKLNDFKKFVESHILELEDAYAIYNTITVIPQQIGATMAETLKAFVAAYADILDEQISSSDAHKAAKEQRAKIFRMFYMCPSIISSSIYSLDDIAVVFDLTRERVRQILANMTEDARNILLGQTVNRIAAEASLSEWFKDVDSRIGNVISLNLLRTIADCNEIDPYTERFFFSVLGLTISQDKNREQIACRGNLNTFTSEIGKITKFFRERAIPVLEFDFNIFLSRNFKDPKVREYLRDFVKTSEMYESGVTDTGEKTVAMKWEYLEFIGAEIARLMYDNKIFSAKDAWSRDDIVKAYNRIAPIYKKEAIERSTPFRHNMLLPCGKTGYYKLKSFNEKFIEGQEFARLYVKKHGKDSRLSDFRDLCKKEGYYHIYNERSIDTFFISANKPFAGRKHKKNSDVLQAIIDVLSSNGRQMLLSHLSDQIPSFLGESIGYPRLMKLLEAGEGELFHTEKGRKFVTVTLMPGAASADLTKFEN